MGGGVSGRIKPWQGVDVFACESEVVWCLGIGHSDSTSMMIWFFLGVRVIFSVKSLLRCERRTGSCY